MAKSILVVLLFFSGFWLSAQSFEIGAIQDTYRGTIGDVVKAPLKIKNTSDRTITLVVRKIQQQIGSTQKNFYCIDNNCLDQKVNDVMVRIDPGQTFNGLQFALDAGLVPGLSNIRYFIFNRANPSFYSELDLSFLIEEKSANDNIYQSKNIQLHDVYPNPATEHAFANYKILNDKIKAKIRLRNLLGNIVAEYDLIPSENFLRIRTDELSSGIYFYSLYVDNESVMTRKLIVKKWFCALRQSTMALHRSFIDQP